MLLKVVFESERYDAVVIGAGVAGLTAAADMAKRNMRTLVLERHNVPGGCASFFQRDGYRFDVGATLLGGFGARGVHRLFNARLGIVVSPTAVEPAMLVHLPRDVVVRYGDGRWPSERVRAFGAAAEPFWAVQERIADAAWDFAARGPAWPVDAPSTVALLRALRPGHARLATTLGRTVSDIIPPEAGAALRRFVDAQLLITAQTDAARATLAYGCTALDLAREGTFHLPDGVSALSVALARSVRTSGSTIRYGAGVAAIETSRGRVRGVRLEDGTTIACDRLIAAIPVHDVSAVCPAFARRYRPTLAVLPQRYGAFTVYCGLPAGVVPADFPLHHQVVATLEGPLGEGASVFLSFSGAADGRRARNGGRAVTLSTHTDVAFWERAYRDGRAPALRAEYARRLTAALDRVLPGAAAHATVLEPADPQTFARYTARRRGLVGGLPQTRTVPPFTHHTSLRGLYLAGDTTFPGQSTVGAALSALAASRAARSQH